jgi:protoporphyrinogen/coproporphyrinogen III oxidase
LLIPSIGFNQLHDLDIEVSAARGGRRFVYYPDGLAELTLPPRSIADLIHYLTHPVFSGTARAVLFFLKNQMRVWQDESFKIPADLSVGDFYRWVLGREDVVDNLVSAIFHGIYGGDIDKLSMRDLSPAVWYRFFCRREHNHVLMPQKNIHLMETLGPKVLQQSPGVFPSKADLLTFPGGMQTLTHTIRKELDSRPNVTFALNSTVEKLRYDRASNTTQVSFTN